MTSATTTPNPPAGVDERQYQINIIAQGVNYFVNTDINSVMYESPTGSGKTYMGLRTAQDTHDVLASRGEDMVIVWVAMRRFLLRQIVKEVEKFGITAPIIPMSMFDSDVANIRKQIGNKKIMIVLDEAHHDAATSMTDVYEKMKPDFILGLSATPYRADKAKLTFSKQIRDAGIHRLISDGYLSKFDLYMAEEWKPETLAELFFRDREKWGRSVFYFLTTDQAQHMHKLLVDGGCPSHLVLGTDNEGTRINQLKDFQSGKVQCLVNCMVLTEGFDCPSLKTAWVRPSSRGPTMQMAGRAFRIHGETPRKQIVQSRDTKWPITKTAPAENQYILQDGKWLSIKANDKVNEISMAALRSSIENTQPMPDFILKKKGISKKTAGARGNGGFWG